MPELNEVTVAITESLKQGGAQIVQWFGYIFWSLLILGGMFAFYTFIQYKLKYFYGVRGAGATNIIALKTDKLRVIRQHGVDKWKTLYSRETFEPFENKFIYPGNTVIGLKLDRNKHIPALYSFGNPNPLIEPLPRSVKFWEHVESINASAEYQNNKDKLMPVIIMTVTIVLCLVLVGLTVWWTTKNIGGGLQQVASQVGTLQKVAQGIGPG